MRDLSPTIVGATWQKEGDWAALDLVITPGRFCCVIVTFRGVPPPVLPVASDEGVGRAVVPQCRLLGALQLRDDPLREGLSELPPN